MYKCIISIIIITAFFAALVPAPDALALRQQTKEGGAIAEMSGKLSAAKGAGEANEVSGVPSDQQTRTVAREESADEVRSLKSVFTDCYSKTKTLRRYHFDDFEDMVPNHFSAFSFPTNSGWLYSRIMYEALNPLVDVDEIRRRQSAVRELVALAKMAYDSLLKDRFYRQHASAVKKYDAAIREHRKKNANFFNYGLVARFRSRHASTITDYFNRVCEFWKYPGSSRDHIRWFEGIDVNKVERDIIGEIKEEALKNNKQEAYDYTCLFEHVSCLGVMDFYEGITANIDRLATVISILEYDSDNRWHFAYMFPYFAEDNNRCFDWNYSATPARNDTVVPPAYVQDIFVKNWDSIFRAAKVMSDVLSRMQSGRLKALAKILKDGPALPKEKQENGKMMTKEELAQILKPYQKNPEKLELMLMALAEIDFYFALSERAIEYDDVIPNSKESKKGVPCLHIEAGLPLNLKDYLIEEGKSKKLKLNLFSINLGGNSSDKVAVVTGPYEYGKSCLLRAIAYFYSMAALGGPVPARLMEWSPAIVRVLISAEDSPSRGKSLSRNTAEQLASLLNFAKEKGKETPVILLIDEPFRGTAPDDTASAQITYALQAKDIKNCLLIMTTQDTRVALRLAGEKGMQVLLVDKTGEDGILKRGIYQQEERDMTFLATLERSGFNDSFLILLERERRRLRSETTTVPDARSENSAIAAMSGNLNEAAAKGAGEEAVRAALVLSDRLISGSEIAKMLVYEIDGKFDTAFKFIPHNIDVKKLKELIGLYRQQGRADLIVVKANLALESKIRKIAKQFGAKIVCIRSEDKQLWRQRLSQM